jgi:ATP-dependent helicase/nuclease subunit A
MNNARLAARVETRNEYRRLLYVAMTRAAERLIVCGIEANKRPEGCWYDLVLQGLRDQPGFSEHEADGVKLWRYRKVEPSGKHAPAANEPRPVVEKPAWLKLPLAAEPRVSVLTPSGATETQDRLQAPATAAGRAARPRGILVHRLLQSLPDIPRERRAKVMDTFLAREGAELDAAEQSSLAEQVMLVLEDPRFSELYGPGSRAEVPIVGRLKIKGETVAVSGQVDRLAVTQDFVLIGDFKTNRQPPRRIEDVPAAYVRQLALYRAVLAQLYPGKLTRAALVWTEVPDLMELSEADMDEALARVTSA